MLHSWWHRCVSMMAKVRPLCYFFLFFFFKKLHRTFCDCLGCWDAGTLYPNLFRGCAETWWYGHSPNVKDYLRCIIIRIYWENIFLQHINHWESYQVPFLWELPRKGVTDTSIDHGGPVKVETLTKPQLVFIIANSIKLQFFTADEDYSIGIHFIILYILYGYHQIFFVL